MGVIYHPKPMSTPRFQPRRYSTEPDVFGKARHIEWRDLSSGDEGVQLVASQIQHDFAVAIRDAVRTAGYSGIKAYAQATGADYQRLSKVLRGEAIMRLEDIADAHLHLGIAVPLAKEGPQ